MKYSAWWILSVAALVTACAGVPRDDGDVSALERHMAYAGDPVDRFYFPQRIRGWSPVDREHLLVRTELNKAYLLAVEPGCIGLLNTQSIGLTSQFGRTDVTSGFDEIRLEHDRCRIVEIRPLDYERMRAEQRIDADEIRQATLGGE
jgi:hypothetical protein